MNSQEKIEIIIRNEEELENTLDASILIGKRVISKSGTIVGRVAQIRLHPTEFNLEGVVVSRGFGQKRVYFGGNYINRASHSGVFLTIDPSILLVGRKVLQSTGKHIGHVKSITRKANTNELNTIVVGAFLKQDMIVPANALKIVHEAIIIDSAYDAKQKYNWQKP